MDLSRTAKTIYILLALVLIFDTHVITRGWWGFSEAQIESADTVLMLLTGYGVYRLERRRAEQLERRLAVSGKKLNDAFRYIGIVNRRLPLLDQLTTDLLRKTAEGKGKKAQKGIFQELLATAVVSLCKADWGVFRFIDTSTGRTEKEFSINLPAAVEIGNKSLSSLSHGLQSLANDTAAIRCSDASTPVQCFLVFGSSGPLEPEVASVVQNVVDQAQLFYRYLYERQG